MGYPTISAFRTAANKMDLDTERVILDPNQQDGLTIVAKVFFKDRTVTNQQENKNIMQAFFKAIQKENPSLDSSERSKIREELNTLYQKGQPLTKRKITWVLDKLNDNKSNKHIGFSPELEPHNNSNNNQLNSPHDNVTPLFHSEKESDSDEIELEITSNDERPNNIVNPDNFLLKNRSFINLIPQFRSSQNQSTALIELLSKIAKDIILIQGDVNAISISHLVKNNFRAYFEMYDNDYQILFNKKTLKTISIIMGALSYVINLSMNPPPEVEIMVTILRKLIRSAGNKIGKPDNEIYEALRVITHRKFKSWKKLPPEIKDKFIRLGYIRSKEESPSGFACNRNID